MLILPGIICMYMLGWGIQNVFAYAISAFVLISESILHLVCRFYCSYYTFTFTLFNFRVNFAITYKIVGKKTLRNVGNSYPIVNMPLLWAKFSPRCG